MTPRLHISLFELDYYYLINSGALYSKPFASNFFSKFFIKSEISNSFDRGKSPIFNTIISSRCSMKMFEGFKLP